MQFRKKPVVIDAVEWDETTATRLSLEEAGMVSAGHAGHRDRPNECTRLRIHTLEGSMLVNRGDWIIRGVKGEFYPCKPDIFAATYESVAATPPETTPRCQPHGKIGCGTCLMDSVTAARGAPETPPDGWQPIATAPRNTRILIYCPSEFPDARTVFEAWWRMPYESAPADDCWWCYDGDKMMLSADVHKTPSGKPLGATLWMPMPSPLASGPATPPAPKVAVTLKRVRAFIEYARYVLKPGKAAFPDQFPKQDDADEAIMLIDHVLRAALAPPETPRDWDALKLELDQLAVNLELAHGRIRELELAFPSSKGD